MRRFLSIFGRPALKSRGPMVGLLVVAGAALVATPIAAQILSPQMQQMLGGGRGGQSGLGAFGGGQSQDDSNSTVLMQPGPQPSRPLPRSAVEQILSARAGVQLDQFGYREMGVPRAVLLPQSGGVQENYILGPGDEIVVTLRGQEAGEFRTFVDRNGRVILPKLTPINVAGRSFSAFQQDLTAAVQRAYVATDAFVTLGRVRQIRVTVGGEVNNPGLRVMTGLASAVDAIFVSNGVKKTGSLRNIQILRGGQRIRVDLYGILRGTAGAQAPLLTDGDRLIVNPLGATVAIAGPVRIPGIYELAPGQSGMTASALITMAGGYTVRGRYDLSLIGLAADGRTQLSNLPNDRTLVRDSDVLIVRAMAEQTVGRATLQAGAASAFSGNYATQATRLSEMLRSPGTLGDDPYSLFAIISRRDPTTLLRTLVPITPAAVLSGRQDFTLQSDDIVHTFTRTEATNLINAINWFDERRQRQDGRIQREGEAPLLGRPQDLPPRSPRASARNSVLGEAGDPSNRTDSEIAEEELRDEYNDAYVRAGDNTMYGARQFNGNNGYNDGTGYGVGAGYNTGFDNSGYNTDAELSGGGRELAAAGGFGSQSAGSVDEND
ncbi:MAG: polysaccharide biosynthesis/export family protein, partial [Pseudomonadota bacterium]